MTALNATKLRKGIWLIVKPTAPSYLRVHIDGPVQVIKKVNKVMFLRGQQDFKATIPEVLKHFDQAPDLKICR